MYSMDVHWSSPIAALTLGSSRTVIDTWAPPRIAAETPSLKLDDAVDFRSAAVIYRAARRAGSTIRSVNDGLIAAAAVRHGVKHHSPRCRF